MKVCIVSTAPPTQCGIANYCLKLMKALRSEGSSKFIVLADKRKPAYDNAPATDGRIQIVRTWTRNSFRYPFEIFRSVLSEKPDVIHVQHEYLVFGSAFSSGFFPVLLLLLRLLHKPLIITMHSVIPRNRLTPSFFNKYGLGKGLTFFGKLFMFLVTVAIGFFASKVIVHLKTANRTLVMDYKFKPIKVIVIPHGVDTYKLGLNSYDARKKLNLDGKKIILFFGFVRPSKGIEHLIEAMPIVVSQCSDTILLIVGNCHPYLTPKGVDYLSLLNNRVHELGLDEKVFFVSRFVPEEELYLFFSACDLVVFPYIEDDILGASGALSSTIWFKKPTIATNVGRFAEDISDGENGLLVPPADPNSLAKAIISVLSNAELSQKFSEKLYKKAEERCWGNIAQKTYELYRKCYITHNK